VIEISGEFVRFTHPLLASAYYAAAPAPRCRELHRTLAEIIEDVEERARHLALGAEAPDRKIALALEQAASSAARRGAPDTAALLLEDAVRLTPLDAAEARMSRVIAAAEHHAMSGSAVRARELLEDLVPELPEGGIRARALIALAGVRSDDWGTCEELLLEALTDAAEHDRVRARIEIELAGVSSNRGTFAAMLVHADSAILCAERAEDPGLLAAALATRAVAAAFNGHPVERDMLRQAIDLEDTAPGTTYYSPSGFSAQILFWADDYVRARPALEQMVQRAQRRGEEYDVAALTFELAILEWNAGNRVAAERHLVLATDAVREQGDYSLDLWLVWGESLFTAGRGELEQAGMLARRAVALAEQSADVLIGALPSIVLASVELWAGRPRNAHNVLGPVREALTSAGFGMVGSLTLGLWSVDIEALIACGELEEGQRVSAELLTRAGSSDNPNAIAIAHRCRGLLLGARGDLGAAIDALELALGEHARRLLAPEVARTTLELGTLQRRAKRKSAAKRSLEQALATLEPIDARMWTARARDELSRIGLRRPTVSDGLTPAQTRVAELAVQGMSNREISSTLYMSTRSVEAHLTKVYRELGVRSRAQLIAALTSEGGAVRNAAVPPTRSPLEQREQQGQGEAPQRGPKVEPIAHADESPTRGVNPLQHADHVRE
jgi:DNA-binding CsgD family transcriptional regulator